MRKRLAKKIVKFHPAYPYKWNGYWCDRWVRNRDRRCVKVARKTAMRFTTLKEFAEECYPWFDMRTALPQEISWLEKVYKEYVEPYCATRVQFYAVMFREHIF